MTQLTEYEAMALDALQRAVADALERKRRLGQYAVVWREDRPVFIGRDEQAGHDKYDAEVARNRGGGVETEEK